MTNSSLSREDLHISSSKQEGFIMDRLFYAVISRYGYHFIDEFSNPAGDSHSGCTRSVECFTTKKLAVSVCRELNTLAAQLNESRGTK